MTKGTTSQGPRHLKAHTFCRRCGRRAFHRQKKECGACGFPRTTMRRINSKITKKLFCEMYIPKPQQNIDKDKPDTLNKSNFFWPTF